MDAFATLAATWPAAETRRHGPWTLSRGDGGGNRVSAATLDAPGGEIAAAEAAMRAWGQTPLIMIRPGETDLDARLAALGYTLRDPTRILAAPTAEFAGAADRVGAIRCSAPIARMEEIWTAGGIGPSRRAVMDRAEGPKLWLLGRIGDRPAACAFVAAHGSAAMLHALEVAPEARRRGLGRRLTAEAARWAGEQGCMTLALAVTEANAAARALYAAMGMREVARYHYRIAPQTVPLSDRNG